MNEKTSFGFISLLFVLLISIFAAGGSAASNTVVATDPQNDVSVSTWNNQTNSLSVNPGQSKPVVDIVSLSYGISANGNMTVTLTMAGTPIFNDYTFYEISLHGVNLTADAWTGNGTSLYSPYCSQSCDWIYSTESANLHYNNNSAVISGDSVIWTFPSQAPALDSNYNLVMQNLNLPATPNASWIWTAEAWTGTSTWASSQTSGTWWVDYLSSDNNFNLSLDTSGLNASSSSSSLPGLDIMPVISVLMLSSVTLLVQKRRKKKIA